MILTVYVLCFYQLVDLEDIFHSDTSCDRLFTVFLGVTDLWVLMHTSFRGAVDFSFYFDLYL